MIRVVIVEEVGLLRVALREVLGREDDVDVVADVRQPDELIEVVPQLRPDVIVIDVERARVDVADFARRVHAAQPGSAVLALSATRSPQRLRRAVRAGVRGFVCKDVTPQELIQQVRLVARGEWIVDPVAAVAALGDDGAALTRREREVLLLAAEGRPAKEIARQLFLAEGTVRNHLSAVLRKTGTRNRLEAVRHAERMGWLWN